MKLIFKLIKLSFVFFIFIEQNNLKAQGTWIEVYRWKSDNNDSLFTGYVHYIDMKSVVMNGDTAYFNWNIALLNSKGVLTKSSPLELNKDYNSARINCKNNTRYIAIKSIWSPIDEDDPWAFYSDIVCEGNKRKWKFW